MCTNYVYTNRHTCTFSGSLPTSVALLPWMLWASLLNGSFVVIQTDFQHLLWLKEKEHTEINFPKMFQLNKLPLEGAHLLIITGQRSSKIMTLQSNLVFRSSCQIAFLELCPPVIFFLGQYFDPSEYRSPLIKNICHNFIIWF